MASKVMVERPSGFDHYKFSSEDEKLDYLDEVCDALIHAAGEGFKPYIRRGLLVIPGWGIELCIELNSIGSVTGFLDDTSGG